MEDGSTSGSSVRRPAIAALARSIRRTRAGLKDPKRAERLFIFPRPRPAWGRPSWPRRWAEFLFDDEDALIQLDMSEVHGEGTR